MNEREKDKLSKYFSAEWQIDVADVAVIVVGSESKRQEKSERERESESIPSM